MGNRKISKNLAIKLILNSFLTIVIVFTIIQFVNYTKDVIALGVGSFNDFIINYIRYMGTLILPITTVFAVILFWFAYRIQKDVAILEEKGTLSSEELKNLQKRTINYKTMVIIINVIGFTAGYIVDLIIANKMNEIFYFFRLITLINNIASGVIYAAIQNSINNIILSKAMQLQRIHSIKNIQKRNSINVKAVFLTFALTVYLLLFFYSNYKDLYKQELIYSSVLEKVYKNEIKPEQAEGVYQRTMAKELLKSSSRIQLKADRIKFPANYSTVRDRENGSYIIIIVYSLFLILIAMGMQIAYSTDQKKQIKSLILKMDDMIQGDGDLTKRINISQFDEIGELGSRINKFIKNLQTLLLNVIKVSDTVVKSTESINNSTKSTYDAAKELKEFTEDVHQKILFQLKEAENTSDNFINISKSINSINESVEKQVNFISATSSSIEEMAANINSVNNISENAKNVNITLQNLASKGTESIQNTISAIKKIEAASKEVSEIVTTISNIADQTDILSMNAAIEAAHAGVHGRGFAVVASEVKKLAETSAKGATEIKNKIKIMEKTITNGIKLANLSGRTLKDIFNDANNALELIEEVSAAMHEQSNGANEILSAVSSVVDTTQSIKDQIQDEQKKCENIKAHVEKLVQHSKEINQTADKQAEKSKNIVEDVNIVSNDTELSSKLTKSLIEQLEKFKL